MNNAHRYIRKRLCSGYGYAFAYLIVVVIWQGSKIAQTKLKVDAEKAGSGTYQKIAEETLAVQSQISKDLTEISERIAKIEKILREVG